MFIGKVLDKGGDVAIIVRSQTEERLRTTCFRDTTQPLAGKFFRWSSVEELFHDHEVMEHFLAELSELWSQQEFGTSSVSIVHSMPVGWESTAPRSNYAYEDLEEFQLNRRSSALRVDCSRTDLLAPKTSELTIVFEFKRERDESVAVVHSIYPGVDIGELNGDVSEREWRVFFDWNHPGQA